MARLKITQLCKRCGNPFHPWPKRKDQEAREFCSPACREIPELERFWSLVDKTPGLGPKGECWEFTGQRDKDGYGKFTPSGVRVRVGAHRYSWKIENGPIPEDKPCVLHRCDNPPCVRPFHLFTGTNVENTADKVAKGRAQKGEDHGMAIVGESEVREIRERYAQGGISQTALGLEYGIEQTSVSQIVLHKCWKHIN